MENSNRKVGGKYLTNHIKATHIKPPGYHLDHIVTACNYVVSIGHQRSANQSTTEL